MSKAKVRDLFDTLSYGPCPESDAAVKAWIAAAPSPRGVFIDNQWKAVESRKVTDSISPADKKVLGPVLEGTDADIAEAVESAKKAQVAWAALSPHERAKHLYSVARHCQKHARLLAVVEALDNGKPFRETKSSDVPLLIRHFYYMAGWAQVAEEEFPDYKPVGVVGAIVPWYVHCSLSCFFSSPYNLARVKMISTQNNLGSAV